METLDDILNLFEKPKDPLQFDAIRIRIASPAKIRAPGGQRGLVVAVEPDRFYAREVVTGLVELLRKGMSRGREYGPSELREIVGLSRKYLIPFLEYCDRERITERRTTGRVLAGPE